MNYSVKVVDDVDLKLWDSYVMSQSHGAHYHLSGWKEVVEKTYGLKTFYSFAFVEEERGSAQIGGRGDGQRHYGNERVGKVKGVLPLVLINDLFVGKCLLSLPFLDYSGILTGDRDSGRCLLKSAVELGVTLGARRIELRQFNGLLGFSKGGGSEGEIDYVEELRGKMNEISVKTSYDKVRMVLQLPASAERLLKGFKSKLRSQIKKPLKEGLYNRVGGIELLEDFYEVFSVNMRDLGSPVHSKLLMGNVLKTFPDQAKIIMVYKGQKAVACGFIIGFKDTIMNPWASALREYSSLSPNMLLYWSMLEYACDNGYDYFDLGRSSPGTGTHKFKKQWGTHEIPLYWHHISLENKKRIQRDSTESNFNKGVNYWKRLPVSITKFLGPMLRKRIGL